MVGFGSTWTTILKHRGEAGIQLVYQSGSKVSASLGLSFEMICFKITWMRFDLMISFCFRMSDGVRCIVSKCTLVLVVLHVDRTGDINHLVRPVA